MKTIWKTAPLFVGDLPPMGGNYPVAVRWHFADMAALPVPAKPPEGAWGNANNIWCEKSSQRGATMAEARKMAREGWPEGAETARRLHAGMQVSMPQRQRLARFDVAGAVPHVARAIAGNPASMRRLVASETRQRPVLTLVCDISNSWCEAPENMLAHAVATAGVVDFLEEGGFRCEVITVARVCRSDVIGTEIAVRLKAAEQPVSLAAMAYGLGHPAFYRRLMFAVWYGHAEVAPIKQGLGGVEVTRPAPEAGTFTTPASGNNSGDAAARFRVLLATLANQGCPGIPEELHIAA